MKKFLLSIIAAVCCLSAWGESITETFTANAASFSTDKLNVGVTDNSLYDSSKQWWGLPTHQGTEYKFLNVGVKTSAAQEGYRVSKVVFTLVSPGTSNYFNEVLVPTSPCPLTCSNVSVNDGTTWKKIDYYTWEWTFPANYDADPYTLMFCSALGSNLYNNNVYVSQIVVTCHKHTSGVHHEAVAPTCTVPGNIEYWECDCGKKYSDADLTNAVTDVMIPAIGHDFTHTPHTISTCTSEGVVEHWHCSRCGHDFNTGEPMAPEDHVIDGNLTVPRKVSDVILVGMDEGLTIDECHTFTPPTEEGTTTVATVTFGEEGTLTMEVADGEPTSYAIFEDKPLETFFAHTFNLTAEQDPANTSDYYATFFTSECAYKVSDDRSAKAYTGILDNEQIEIINAGDIIHKSEAVMLKADRSDITLMPSCNKAAATGSNDLIGTDVAKTLGAGDFALSFGEDGVGFYNWNGQSIGDNEAYLTGSPDVENLAIVVYDGVIVRVTIHDNSVVTICGLKKVEFIKENNIPAVCVTNADDSTVTYENPKEVEFGK